MVEKRKFYFMNYSKFINLTRKVHGFIFEQKNCVEEFHYKNLGKFIKKRLYRDPMINTQKDGKKKYIRSSLVKNDLLSMIKKCFKILQDLGYIIEFDFEYVPEQDSYIIQVTFGNEVRNFDDVVRESKYFPIEGEKQELTDELRNKVEKEYLIDYESILSKSPSNDYGGLVKHFNNILPNRWISKYKIMAEIDTNIIKIPRHFTFIFDLQSELMQNSDENFVEDRVVVSYGLSKLCKVKRDARRMAGYLRDAFEWTDKGTDKGHFIGHSLGGGVDENIIPQKKEINRGQSTSGKVYRKMEEYCATNQGTFCFSRPIYCDFSTRPFILEYGVLKRDTSFWVEHFVNV